jgi:DNA-binding MarR family transcriptional regulator
VRQALAATLHVLHSQHIREAMTEDEDEDVLPKLTPLQEQYLDYIQDRIEKDNLPPTQREIAAHFKRSLNAAQLVVHALVKKGRIRILYHIPRGIKLVAP